LEAISEYNARVQEQEARQIEARTALAQRRQAEAGERTMGALRARLGKAGAVMTTGAPLMIQAEQASELEMENLMIGYKGATAAQRTRSQAKIDKLQAKIYGKRAKTAMIEEGMKAGTTLITGF